jgi:hypothetical protein
MQRPAHLSTRRFLLAAPLGLILAATVAMPVFAHAHTAGPSANRQGQFAGQAQVLADGQLHPGFVYDVSTGTVTSCGQTGDPAAGGIGTVGPAWYGLETAHHGPDIGSPGKNDGCYTQLSTNGKTPIVQNPAIK